jgi:hypothetical protein
LVVTSDKAVDVELGAEVDDRARRRGNGVGLVDVVDFRHLGGVVWRGVA